MLRETRLYEIGIMALYRLPLCRDKIERQSSTTARSRQEGRITHETEFLGVDRGLHF